MQLLFYGMTYPMILEKLSIFIDLKTFYNPRMAMNVNIILINSFNIS